VWKRDEREEPRTHGDTGAGKLMAHSGPGSPPARHRSGAGYYPVVQVGCTLNVHGATVTSLSRIGLNDRRRPRLVEQTNSVRVVIRYLALTEAAVSLAFFSRLSSWLGKVQGVSFACGVQTRVCVAVFAQPVVASSKAFSRSFSSARICFLSSLLPRVTAASTRASVSCAATTRRPL
jgi:hypothetical protein